MKQTNNFRHRFKYLLTKYLSNTFLDKLRNLLSIRHKFFYNRKLKKKVIEIKNSFQGPISSNLDLLISLDAEFKTINLSANYNFENLMLSSKQRFNYLKDMKVPLKGKKLADFGAGHGENLFLCKELDLSEAVGLDFSDKDFLPHKSDLDPKTFNFIDFRILDLVKEPLGIENFDLIMSFSAFEHFEDPKSVLYKCYQALSVGGYLYAEFAAFNSPYATHRKIFCRVPHIQNMFEEEISFKFFYEYLKINDKKNRYTNEPILDGNPYPEVNRLLIEDYESIFLDEERWNVVDYTKTYNYQYDWFIRCFEDSFENKSKDYKYVDYLKFLIRKK